MSEKTILRSKLFLSLSVLTFSATQILLFTLLPFLSETLSLPLSDIILSLSLGTILFLWGSPFWANKSDIKGRVPVICIGLAGLALSFGIIVFLIQFHSDLSSRISLALLILSRVIYGLFASAIVPAAQLARKDLVTNGEHLSSMLSHSLSLSLGRTIGPLLLLIFQSQFNYLFFAMMIWPLFLIGGGFQKDKAPVVSRMQLSSGDWLTSLSLIKLPFLVTILFTVYVGILHSSLGHKIEVLFNFSGIEASTLMAKLLFTGSFVMAISQLFGKILLKNHFRSGLWIGLFSLVVGAIVLAYMNSLPELWIAISFISAGIAIIQPSHLAMVHSLFPQDKQGKEIGLLSSGNTIGYALGGTLSAFLLGYDIYKCALVIIALLAVAILKNSIRSEV